MVVEVTCLINGYLLLVLFLLSSQSSPVALGSGELREGCVQRLLSFCDTTGKVPAS